jgi:uncharacterized protein YydD (DUF2326 family)
MTIILKRIYSETELFDEVLFKKGINVIRGIYTKKDLSKNKGITDLNGIGKSTLVRLIDFALLSDSTKNRSFDMEKHEFLKGHSVTLEIEVDGKTFVIKRSFDDSKKPQFGVSNSGLEVYDEIELKKLLGTILFETESNETYLESNWFRKLIRFFIKDDLNNFERDDPLNFLDKHLGKSEIYSYNLFLLGLPNKSMVNFDELKKSNDELKKQKRKILERLKEDTGKDLDQIGSEISILDSKIKMFEDSLKNYDFLEAHKDVEKELIALSGELSELMIKLNFLERSLNEYKQSYKYKIEFDKEKVVNVYNEINLMFGEIIKKSLDEVLDFRKRLSENRQKFLREKEVEISNEIESVGKKISSLEERRSILYKVLEERKAFDTIKNTYSLLIEEKTKKEKLLAVTSQIGKLDEEIYDQKIKITGVIKEISEDIQSVKTKISKISSIYFEIIKNTIHINNLNEAVFEIRPEPDENSPLKIIIDVPKSEALGKNRFKILAYDLTTFLNIIDSERKMPHFLIHDGVFHGIDRKTIIRTLNLINSKFLLNPDFQYIITANEDELIIPSEEKENYGDYNFNIIDSIIATYKDIPEEMIFKREY